MTPDENRRITQVGRGTPLGRLMRRYWHPVALSSQIAAPDSAPLRVKLLGEAFVVFRDTKGRVGVLNDRCMHRGVSLSLGRVEECGIRCLYHGWKFDVEGNILETPNHSIAAYRERVKAPAYPVQERSGLIWTYIGPKAEQPPFRTFDYDLVPDAHRCVLRANTKANWLALLEGGVDSSHVGMLHTNNIRKSWVAKARGETVTGPSNWDSLAPTYELEDTDYGFRYVAFRALPDKDDRRHARQTTVMLPYTRSIPGDGFAITILEVPASDTETSTYMITYSHDKPIDPAWAKTFLGLDTTLLDPRSCDVDMSWPDGLHQDRANMKTSWSGFGGVELEDFAMALSYGDDWERSGEHLVAADVAVVKLRRSLMSAIDRHEAGEAPIGAALADMTRVVPYDEVVRNDQSWKDVLPYWLRGEKRAIGN